MFRHLFGVTEAEAWTWTENRWLRHKAFADEWLSMNNLEMR